MKVRFIKDAVFRCHKTGAVLNSFKSGETYEMTDLGGAHYIAAGDAEVADQAAAVSTAAVSSDEAQASVSPASEESRPARRNR